MRAWVAIAYVISAAACLEPNLVVCGDKLCPAGQVCTVSGCAAPDQVDVCAGKAEQAACATSSITAGVCHGGACRAVDCGDGMVEGSELCDDGNQISGDGCSAHCDSTEVCGNGVVDVAIGEQCDDGNTVDGDSCSHDCLVPRCGDGVVDRQNGEACDDGAANSLAPDAACRPNCQPRRCGDGILDTGEVCDDGNLVSGDGCSGDCLSTEVCGNGIVDLLAGEQCDDGNADNADTCHNDCTIPRCGDAIIDPQNGEACDDGAANSNAPDVACRLNCQAQRCGDHIVDGAAGEVCDDGNLVPRDGCSPDCRSNETCGNGIVDYFVGEVCDDGNAASHDGCSPRCRPELPVWTHIALQPTGKLGAMMAYDAARRRTVLFGGDNDAGQSSQETWEWNGASWVLRTVPTSPPARSFGAMVYDPVLHRVVLFGGVANGVNGTVYNDLWAFDGNAWSLLPAASSPSTRAYHAMAYDAARHKLVMTGGYHQGYLAETWEWDGTTWSQSAPAHSPSGRAYHMMAYDPRHTRIVLFGGLPGGAGLAADTWTFDGTDWTQMAPATSPPASMNAAMVDDPVDRRVILLGGTGSAGMSDTTWEWDGADWSSYTATSPGARQQHGLAYDLARGQVVAFGGLGGAALSDTWTFDAAGWTQRTLPASPYPRDHAPLAYDSARGRVVMFGGLANVGQLADTWEWDGASWLQRTPVHVPPPRYDAALGYDAIRRRTVLYGGWDNDHSVPFADTWTWDGNDWTERSPALSPPPRQGGALAFDVAHGNLVLSGGFSIEATNVPGDTWTWDGTTWTHADTVQLTYDHASTWDDEHGAVVTLANNTLWQWSGAGWQSMSGSIPYRTNGAMTFDGGHVLVFGGTGTVGSLGDTWEHAAAWTQITPVTSPPPRQHPRLVFDAARGRALSFGGYGGVVDPADTWTFRWEAATPDEACASGVDYDGDGLIGCADDDCWAVCTPTCSPNSARAGACSRTDPTAQRCGDGTCALVEDCRSCPTDCGACPALCGDFMCDAPESHASCPADCP